MTENSDSSSSPKLVGESVLPPLAWTATEPALFGEVLRERDRRLADALAELKLAQEQSRRSQKMEAVGHLVAGIAHEFNNVLTGVLGYAELVLQLLPENDPSRKFVVEMHQAGERAAALVRQILAFSRKQVPAPMVLDINAVVAEGQRMLSRLIGENIDLTSSLDPNLGRVKADPALFHQVLMNLVVNARDAMPEGGRLVIETANIDFDEAYALTQPDVRPGRYVLLAVSDTGCGMDEKIKARIFEPFFTTKEQGKGTGLGLATVAGIVKQSGGHIDVDSEPGLGTNFRIYLPRFDGQRVASQASAPAPIPNHLKCLVVEDDNALRDLMAIFLSHAGHRVEAAPDGRQALDAFLTAKKQDDPFDVVVTDVVMPEVGGVTVAREVKAASPGTPILLVTGYGPEILTDDIRKCADFLLLKPFMIKDLLGAIAQAIAACCSKESLPEPSAARASSTSGVTEVSTRAEKPTDDRALYGHIGAGEKAGLEADQAGISVDLGRLRAGSIAQPAASPLARVLIVDDDPSTQNLHKKAVKSCGCDALAVSSGEEAIRVAEDFCPDILLMDLVMPAGLSGLQTIKRLRPIIPEALAIVITGHAEMEDTIEALRLSVFDFLSKPFRYKDITNAVRRALAYREAQRREKRQRDFLSLVGQRHFLG